MNPRLQWDVGRGETSASEEREGDSRSRSRPGVQLRIDQNATGDESEATPSSSQQGSKRSREDDHRVGDNRAAEAPRKSMGSLLMLFSPWDTWIQHAVQQKERRRTQHAADSVLRRYCDYENWSRRYIMTDGRYPRTRRSKKRPTSRKRARRTVTVVTDGTYGSQPS